MMRAKKGLDDSIWASRGKSTNLHDSSTSNSGSHQPSTSVITPAVPRLPASTTKNGHSSPANGSKPTQTNPPASPASPANGAPRPAPAAQREFKRYIQIVRRLKWKLPYLSHGYHHAVAKPGDPLYSGETNAQEAELMFKLDFYEYYMLLERALIHLLGVFGIKITRDVAADELLDRPAAATRTTRRGGGGYPMHTYHQNVLAALQGPENPLHEALGSGEVLFHLFRAKELRNRWKYAEETAAGAKAGAQGGWRPGRDGTAPLESYDLDNMFLHVFKGFDGGYAVAEKRVAEETGAKARMSWADEVEGMEVETEAEAYDDDDGFGFMVEAMDWEAV